MLKYETEKKHGRDFLALTGLTVTEFEALVEPFATSWQTQMRQKTMDGRKRYERAHSDYRNTPLPRAEDKLLFILVYLKQAPTQVVQGRLFGMTQSNANKWIHLLLPILNETLAALGERPARTATELNARWEALQLQNAEEAVEESQRATPLFSKTAPNDPSNAPAMDPTSAIVANAKRTP